MSEMIILLILWARSKNSESWYGKMTLQGIMDLIQ